MPGRQGLGFRVWALGFTGLTLNPRFVICGARPAYGAQYAHEHVAVFVDVRI